MEETEIQLSAILSEAEFISLVETLAASYGLHIRMLSTLSTYPGSLHWHLVKPNTKGTLELTFWPPGKRAWFSVQSRRGADWIEEILPQLKAELEANLLKQTDI